MQPHEVHGYYTKKIKYGVKTINDFIMKLRRTAVLDKFFKQSDDLNYSGLKDLFDKLFRVTRNQLMDHQLLGLEEEIDQNMLEISNFVMYNLHSEFFYNEKRSNDEKKFQRKIDVLQKLSAADFDFRIDDQMRHAWKMAIKEASRLQEQQTPMGKLQQLQKAIKILAQSYTLYKNEQITADHLATFIPYILVKAKIERVLSHYNYIQAFHFSVNEGDEISVVNTNLNIAITRLKSNDFDEHIKKVDPAFFEREEQLELRRHRKSARGVRKTRSSTG